MVCLCHHGIAFFQANEALNQFRSIDRHNRKQYFYLNLLVQDRSEQMGVVNMLVAVVKLAVVVVVVDLFFVFVFC